MGFLFWELTLIFSKFFFFSTSFIHCSLTSLVGFFFFNNIQRPLNIILVLMACEYWKLKARDVKKGHLGDRKPPPPPPQSTALYILSSFTNSTTVEPIWQSVWIPKLEGIQREGIAKFDSESLDHILQSAIWAEFLGSLFLRNWGWDFLCTALHSFWGSGKLVGYRYGGSWQKGNWTMLPGAQVSAAPNCPSHVHRVSSCLLLVISPWLFCPSAWPVFASCRGLLPWLRYSRIWCAERIFIPQVTVSLLTSLEICQKHSTAKRIAITD